jgi:hypothetical protein
MPYEDANLSDELEQFITSIRLRALEDTTCECCTDSQSRRLAVQIKQALRDPRHRIPVLQAITGLPIHSQNELTFHCHSVIIDETKEPEDGALLREIESHIEAAPDREPVDLFPWYRPVP